MLSRIKKCFVQKVSFLIFSIMSTQPGDCHIETLLLIHKIMLTLLSTIGLFEFMIYSRNVVIVTEKQEDICEISCSRKFHHVDDFDNAILYNCLRDIIEQ